MLNFVYLIYFAALFTIGSPLIGLVIAYFERSKAQTDINRSHATWQIRTVWLTLALLLIAGFTAIFLGVTAKALMALFAVPLIFFIYRTAKGWYLLDKIRPIENPTAML